jgi:uncharacterized protein (TIGR03437 family)
VDVNYAKPTPFIVSPGQIITLFFRGVETLPGGVARNVDAQTVPLPTTLGGLSMKISQPVLASPLPVPLLAVRQDKECDTGSPQCLLTSVRIQVPFELPASTTPRLGPQGVTAPDAELTVEEDGKASRSFLLRPVSENGHVVTSCDLIGDTNPNSVCSRVAYHADGRAVDMGAPAARGETIILFAYGLGQTTPPAATGSASGTGLSVLDSQPPRLIVTVRDNLLNAPSNVPRAFASDPYNLPWAKVDFAGLAPGQVGLYQINVPVPLTFEVPVPCGPDPSINGVRSNGLLQLTTAQGTENIPICVAP